MSRVGSRWVVAAVVVVFGATPVVVAVAGCGSSGSSGSSGGSGDLRVSAAASLRGAFTRYGASFGHASFSFAGSDQLAAQIRAGAHPDVFASANTTLPDSLYKAHLVQRPVPFATNTLVLAVPAHGGRVTSLAGAGGSGVKLVIGAPTVPVGAYTLKVLGRLGAQGRTILSRAVSQEPSVDGIVGKLAAGAADAGFVYITDVSASHGALRAIALPAAAKPSAVYEAAVVTGSSQAARAQSFVAGLVSGAGRAALAAAGFGSPPRSR